MDMFKSLGPDTSDSEAVKSDEEGQHLTYDEFAPCAVHVQKLPRRIVMLQESLKSGQAVDRHRKRRMHKVYQRFCQRFEASIIDPTSAPPTKSSPPIRNRNSLSPDVTGRTQRPSHHRQQSTRSVQSSQSTHRISRKDSQASRQPIISRVKSPVPERRNSRNVDECTIPGCTKCSPDAVEPRPRQSRRQSMLQQPSESGSDIFHCYHYDTRSQVSDPAPYYPSAV